MLSKRMWQTSLVLFVLQLLIVLGVRALDATAVAGPALLAVLPPILFIWFGRRNCAPAAIVAALAAFGYASVLLLRGYPETHPVAEALVFLLFFACGAVLSYRSLEHGKAPNERFPTGAFVSSLSVLGIVLMPVLWLFGRRPRVSA